MGHDLNGLSLEELRRLEHKVSASVDVIRARKVGFRSIYICIWFRVRNFCKSILFSSQ
jgi:hypothetical protein